MLLRCNSNTPAQYDWFGRKRIVSRAERLAKVGPVAQFGGDGSWGGYLGGGGEGGGCDGGAGGDGGDGGGGGGDGGDGEGEGGDGAAEAEIGRRWRQELVVRVVRVVQAGVSSVEMNCHIVDAHR